VRSAAVAAGAYGMVSGATDFIGSSGCGALSSVETAMGRLGIMDYSPGAIASIDLQGATKGDI